ncbi:MAG: PHP domain-containing protein, partial [Cyanobacteria bacterium J06641_5]
MLELHCHTTFSDGTLTPTELVGAAAAAGVRALAITDHDTLGGWSEAQAAATALKADRAVELEIVPGVELSTVCNERSLHILGFYPDRARLEGPLQERVAGRWQRAQAMADKLAALGYPIVLPSLRAGMAPGRPHLARALVAAGYANTAKEAFTRWLHDDGPAYVRYEKFSAVAGIELLLNSGGVPVWAHPYLFRGGEVEAVLPEL